MEKPLVLMAAATENRQTKIVAIAIILEPMFENILPPLLSSFFSFLLFL